MITRRKRYVVSLEIVMDDNDEHERFENLDLGALDEAKKAGEVVCWDYRDTESISDVNPDGTIREEII